MERTLTLQKIRVPVIFDQTEEEAYAVALKVADKAYGGRIYDAYRMTKRNGEWIVTFRIEE